MVCNRIPTNLEYGSKFGEKHQQFTGEKHQQFIVSQCCVGLLFSVKWVCSTWHWQGSFAWLPHSRKGIFIVLVCWFSSMWPLHTYVDLLKARHRTGKMLALPCSGNQSNHKPCSDLRENVWNLYLEGLSNLHT